MSTLLFATGNSNKYYEANKICNQYGFRLEQVDIAIDEIQHRNPEEITKAKARRAYAALGKPIVVNDSSWSIPALNGFPGGYMKDISSWLDESDFLALMSIKNDRTIYLTEVVAYFDGEEMKLFTFRRSGVFVDTPRGESVTPFNKVVVMEGDDMTIAEKISQSDRVVDVSNYRHWTDFAEWYGASKATRRGNAEVGERLL